MRITLKEANELAVFPQKEDKLPPGEEKAINELMKGFDASIQSATDKASKRLKKLHDPYADLSREIRRMTSHDTHTRVH